MSCGRVIIDPTTTLKHPSSMTLFAFSGVFILPSAITLFDTLEIISLIISKSLSSM